MKLEIYLLMQNIADENFIQDITILLKTMIKGYNDKTLVDKFNINDEKFNRSIFDLIRNNFIIFNSY